MAFVGEDPLMITIVTFETLVFALDVFPLAPQTSQVGSPAFLAFPVASSAYLIPALNLDLAVVQQSMPSYC